MNERKKQTIGAPGAVADILIVMAVSVVLFAAEDWARQAGYISLGNDSKGVAAVIGGMVAALALVFLRRQPLREIGFRRPRPLWSLPIWAVAIVVAYLIAQAAVPALVSSVIDLPPPDISRHGGVYRNLPAALALAAILPFTASIPEEIIYRGFLIGRLTRIFGAGALGTSLTLVLQGLIFGAIHFQWGIGGVIVTSIMGIVWGAGFILCGRNLWVVIAAHSLAHILFVAQLYYVDAGAT